MQTTPPIEVPAGKDQPLPKRFNIRVYGVLVSNNRLLVSDEFVRGHYFTKLPGGGLEFSEGTRDCLKREFMEETGLDVTIGEHLYTTDFYQVSTFNSNDQIISIYYHVNCGSADTLATKQNSFDFQPHQVADPKGQAEVFRWIPLHELNAEQLSLPIDKIVVNLLLEQQ